MASLCKRGASDKSNSTLRKEEDFHAMAAEVCISKTSKFLSLGLSISKYGLRELELTSILFPNVTMAGFVWKQNIDDLAKETS